MGLYTPFKGKKGIKRIFYALQYSSMGFKSAYLHEAAFRQIIWLSAVLIPISFYLTHNRIERVLMIAVCLISIIVELLNSAIEAVVDRISLELHPLSKIAKDMGSAAQTVALLLIVVCWGLILWP